MEGSRFAGKVTIPHRFAEPPLHKGAFLRGIETAAPLQPATDWLYKYPPLRSKKIHPVSVRAESSVVAAMQLDVSTPSWPIFFAIT